MLCYVLLHASPMFDTRSAVLGGSAACCEVSALLTVHACMRLSLLVHYMLMFELLQWHALQGAGA